tara:strand:+ start:98 stop:508 length:411 start_codon:yes stop_codon:yes gene_type:complete
MLVKPNCPYCHTTHNVVLPVEKIEYLPAVFQNVFPCPKCGERYYQQVGLFEQTDSMESKNLDSSVLKAEFEAKLPELQEKIQKLKDAKILSQDTMQLELRYNLQIMPVTCREEDRDKVFEYGVEDSEMRVRWKEDT